MLTTSCRHSLQLDEERNHAVLISKADYLALSIVAALPGEFYAEGERPSGITGDRQQHLLKLQLLEMRMLVPKDNREGYPEGLAGYFLTVEGEEAMALFEENNRQVHAEAETKQKKIKPSYETVTQIIIPVAGIVISAIVAIFFQ